MNHPLSDLRILDLSRLLPGPYCTALLARMGAEVIKLEDVHGGDGMRELGREADGSNPVFAALNGGKQSVAFDLKSEFGRAAAQDLAAVCDVVVEGFRPGVVDRLAMDFEVLARRNARLVYCSISGFGQEGPYRDLPGHDLTYAAMTGLLDALFPGGPRVPGVPIVDSATALLAACRILAALHARDAGPQYVDVSLVDAARALMPVSLAEAHLPAGARKLSEKLAGSERTNVYRCADGRWLALTPIEEHFWERLQRVLRDEREIGEEPLSVERQREIFLRRTAEEWFVVLSGHDVPCAVVKSVAEARVPIASGRAPELGEHTELWMERLGYKDAGRGED